MAFAGGFGADIGLEAVPCDGELDVTSRLFSESNTRFLCEVRPDNATSFEEAVRDLPNACIGRVTDDARLVIRHSEAAVVKSDLSALKEAWQTPLRW
jgi:phosphoribosylformylglycinamidine synthase